MPIIFARRTALPSRRCVFAVSPVSMRLLILPISETNEASKVVLLVSYTGSMLKWCKASRSRA